MSKKAFAVTLVVSILMTATAGALFFQNIELSITNGELSGKLKDLIRANENLTNNLWVLNENYTALLSTVSTDFNPPLIETQLGIKLMEASYTAQNYLWVTGQTQNLGNQTLYNVKLRFTLDTNDGTETRDYVIGIMQPHETVTVKTSIFASGIADITTWKLTPVATYVP